MLRQDGQSLVSSPFTTSSQETERVYSYNPGAARGSWYTITARQNEIPSERKMKNIVFRDINNKSWLLQP